MTKIDLIKICGIAKKAGNEILNIYHNPALAGNVEQKKDDSPLTLADKASNQVIIEALKTLYPNIPIISEEEKEIPYEVRKNWTTFWLIDPLDGTKEFIKRNGEFTVNIALVENNITTVGVIYAPVLDIMYWGDAHGAFMQKAGGAVQNIQSNTKTTKLTAAGSRSHGSEEDTQVLAQYDIENFVSMGSSLKFCLVATGEADIYYRSGPTMEWDTAAGQAILKAAGGSVTHLSGEEFKYNKENLLNTGFMCKSAGLKTL
jgi:3'(2'), 5'-bisphosphate nucleotidase